MDAWTVSEAVRELATSPAILGLLEVLYGRRPIPFQTLNFLRGSQQPTHSDAYHFHSYPKHFMCGVWVAFEDTDDDNGAAALLPRLAPAARLRLPLPRPRGRAARASSQRA